MQLTQIRSLAQSIRDNVNRVVVGKEDVIDKLLIAIIASGHVLLEDVPGTGKTLLAKAMAKSVRASFKRIQFTPDLLPSDLSGIHFFNQKLSEFEFRPGPLFTHVLLADEINRATPRTQSSLLECMEERQVSIDGETRTLTRPFFVIATQNPVENQGTFPLPEAQLDRFLFKIKMGYPNAAEGIQILKRFKEANPLDAILGVADAEEIVAAQNSYSQVKVSDDILAYLIAIVEKTRTHSEVSTGVSPRGSQALLKAAQVQAILKGRDFVTPDDIKAVAEPVLAHRLIVKGSLRSRTEESESIVAAILRDVPVPTEDSLISG
ncbi:AAA family ATPase [Paenibacillus periandrae]|uniref:AAA family ATPase n=1 Tax=Paenibacillus periandrae TaxID=1761741 RepID=UPI001F08D45B|nr:MoxR family ATPase [Paenibacillus periandrae]